MQQRLTECDGFAVVDVRGGPGAGVWSPPETPSSYGVVFVRSGCFRRLSEGVEAVLDPTSVYFEAPGREQRLFTRRPTATGGRRSSWRPSCSSRSSARRFPRPPSRRPPFVDLEHRRLLALAHRTPAQVDVEQVMTLVLERRRAGVVRATHGGQRATARRRHGARAPDGRPAAGPARARPPGRALAVPPQPDLRGGDGPDDLELPQLPACARRARASRRRRALARPHGRRPRLRGSRAPDACRPSRSGRAAVDVARALAFRRL